jgi:hypothetical protein
MRWTIREERDVMMRQYAPGEARPASGRHNIANRRQNFKTGYLGFLPFYHTLEQNNVVFVYTPEDAYERFPNRPETDA